MSLSKKYIRNFNPKFINDCFDKFDNQYNISNINKLNLKKLNNEEYFNKRTNLLLYCLNYIDSMLKFIWNLPDELIFINEMSNIKKIELNELKLETIDVLQRKILKNKIKYEKSTINFLLTCYHKVNEFYEEFKYRLKDKKFNNEDNI